MGNIKFDDGLVKFTINGDPEKVVSFDPTDINMGARIMESLEAIEKLKIDIPSDTDTDENESGDLSETAKNKISKLSELDEEIKKQVDHMFNADVSRVVFGNTSTLSPKNGKLFIERFLDAVMPIVQEELEKQGKESQKRVEKHTAKYKKKNVQSADKN